MIKVYAPHIAIIRESIAAVESYRPAEKAAFLADPIVRDAVLMRLQVMGEHLARIRHIDEDAFAETADPSWYKIIGLRNIISHGYETIDWDLVWQMISTELPTLRASLDALTDE